MQTKSIYKKNIGKGEVAMRKHILALLTACCIVLTTVGCQKSTHEAGSISGYDEGEKYLSIWVHSIEDTDEGKCYREAVESFNKAYDGKYFADIEFIPRNDSGGAVSYTHLTLPTNSLV